MNPNEKGWLKEYIDFRIDMLRDLTSDAARKGSHPDHSLYRIIQPTGLMYGQSVGISGHPDQETWQNKEKMKMSRNRRLLWKKYVQKFPSKSLVLSIRLSRILSTNSTGDFLLPKRGFAGVASSGKMLL